MFTSATVRRYLPVFGSASNECRLHRRIFSTAGEAVECAKYFTSLASLENVTTAGIMQLSSRARGEGAFLSTKNIGRHSCHSRW